MKKIKKDLTEQQRNIMFAKGTEPAFSSEHLHNADEGSYKCMNCGFELFSSSSKFDSGTGWPSFDKPTSDLEIKKDFSHQMLREEVVCPNCCAHLGHVFDDGPTKTKKRYCINGCVLEFEKKN